MIHPPWNFFNFLFLTYLLQINFYLIKSVNAKFKKWEPSNADYTILPENFPREKRKIKVGTKFHFSSLFYVKMMCNLLFLEHDQLTC